MALWMLGSVVGVGCVTVCWVCVYSVTCCVASSFQESYIRHIRRAARPTLRTLWDGLRTSSAAYIRFLLGPAKRTDEERSDIFVLNSCFLFSFLVPSLPAHWQRIQLFLLTYRSGNCATRSCNFQAKD